MLIGLRLVLRQHEAVRTTRSAFSASHQTRLLFFKFFTNNMVSIVGAIIGIVIAFILAFVIFTTLERCCPLHKEQKVFRAQYMNDIVHFVINHFITQIALFAFLVFFFVSVRYLFDSRVHHAVRSQHWALRFFEVVHGVLHLICRHLS